MIKVYHYKNLTNEERDRVNKSGWDCEPRIFRYSYITAGLADTSMILEALLNGEYTHVATVDGDRDDAFRLTNHIYHDWRTNPNVVAEHANNYRSTSVGDIFQDTETGELMIVANIGFQHLTLIGRT